MKLDKVQISQFRNIESATIYPSAHLNVVIGQNGSGKSSFLESLHYLGFGRSFRTNKHRHVIKSGLSQFSVFAECSDINNDNHKIGLMRKNKDEFLCSINGKRSQRIADLVSQIPVQIFTPQSTELLLGSPSNRRKFLDWGLFHVEQSFFNLSLNYSKILKAFTPIIPHFAFECLDSLNVQDKINWPNIDKKFLKKEIFNIVVQINGKKRCIKTFEKEISEKDLLNNLKTDEKILRFLDNKPIKKNT